MLKAIELFPCSVFIRKAKSAMDLFYPNWSSASGNADTVCIPPSIDLANKGNFIGSEHLVNYHRIQRTKSKVGRQAETMLLQAFQKLNWAYWRNCDLWIRNHKQMKQENQKFTKGVNSRNFETTAQRI